MFRLTAIGLAGLVSLAAAPAPPAPVAAPAAPDAPRSPAGAAPAEPRVIIMKKTISSAGKPGDPHVMVMTGDGADMMMHDMEAMDGGPGGKTVKMVMIRNGESAAKLCTSTTAEDGTRTIICKISPTPAANPATIRQSLESARKSIEVNRDLSDSQRSKALAGLDRAMAELADKPAAK